MSAIRSITLALSDVCPDLLPQDAPPDMWSAAQNVIFRQERTFRAAGDKATLPGVTGRTRALAYTVVNGTPFWVLVHNGNVYAHDGATASVITPPGWGGNSDAVFSAVTFNGFVVVSASDRDPAYWAGNPSVACEPLPGWPSGGRCVRLVAHKNFLFGVGFTSEGDQRVRWSDAAEAGTIPQTWAPGPDNLAGFVDLAPLWSPCLEAKTLRDSLMVYKQESIHSFTFVGGNAVFQVRKVFGEAGVAGPHSVCAGPQDEHLFLGSDGDAYLTNGVELRSVLDGKRQRTFYAEWQSLADKQVRAASLQREKVGVLAYGDGSCDQALIYDFVTGAVGQRAMPDLVSLAEGPELIDTGTIDNSWEGQGQQWRQDANTWNFQAVPSSPDDLVGGGDVFDGPRYVIGAAEPSQAVGAADFADGPVQAFVQKLGLAMGNPARRKLVSRMWPRVEGQPGDVVGVRVGGQERAGAPVTWSRSVPYTIGSADPVDVFASGRFIALEVASNGGQPWTLTSIDVEYRDQGEF